LIKNIYNIFIFEINETKTIKKIVNNLFIFKIAIF